MPYKRPADKQRKNKQAYAAKRANSKVNATTLVATQANTVC